MALRAKLDSEGDVSFKSGFTIRADKSPNSRGAKEILNALDIPLTSESDVWDGIRNGSIKAVLFFGGDPLDRFSDQQIEALRGVDFLVVQDILSSDISATADVVLPGAAFIEKEGTFTNFAGRVQQISAGLEPPGDARPDWQILKDWVNTFGGSLTFESAAEVMADVARGIPAYGDVNMDAVGSLGLQIPGADA